MLQKFFKYIFQSMAGMLGISVYILADTYFISVYSGADGLAVLNLILPVYGLIYAIGAMIGIGSATRYAIDRAQGKNASFYFLSAVTWDILISIPLVLAGIFIPDKILQLLGADAGLTALGKQYLRIILAASPFFMPNYAFTAFARNDSAPAIAMLGSIAGSMFNIVFDYIFMFPAGLGLTGAALATAFCPLVTMSICGTHYLGKHNQVGFRFRAPSLRHLIACCQLGVSAFVGEISSAVIAIVFNFLLLDSPEMSVSPLTASLPISPSLPCACSTDSRRHAAAHQRKLRKRRSHAEPPVPDLGRHRLPDRGSDHSGADLEHDRSTDPDLQPGAERRTSALRPQRAPAVFPGLSLCWHQHPAGCYFSAVAQPKPAIAGSLLRGAVAIIPALSHWRAVWAERRLAVFPGVGNDHFLRYFAAGKAGTYFQRIT